MSPGRGPRRKSLPSQIAMDALLDSDTKNTQDTKDVQNSKNTSDIESIQNVSDTSDTSRKHPVRMRDAKPAPEVSAADIPMPMQTILPTLSPPAYAPRLFTPMLQGTGTNRFTQLSTRKSSPPVDEITGLATIAMGDLTVFIEKYNQLTGGLRISTHKLLDACTIALTEQSTFRGKTAPETLVSIPLTDYMLRCGVPMTKASKDKMRRRVKEDLETLYSTSLEWTEQAGGGQVRDYAKMRIISAHGIQNGKIFVRFSPEIAQYLTHAYLMQYPLELFKVDERNPSAYYLGKKMLLHHSMDKNVKRGTANLLSVRALLSSAPDIPTYEEVMARDRHLEQRIIQPFENALGALSNTIRWQYANRRGVPLSKKQLEKFDYHAFIECYIRFEVWGAPDREDT